MIRAALERRWAVVPVAMLAATLAFAAVAVSMAVGQPGATAVEPDYYRRGLHYDDYRRQVEQNGLLRWVVTPALSASPADPRRARLEIAVADRHGVAITDAQVTAEVIPISNADRRVTLTLHEAGEGRYAADVPLRTGGQWEVRVEIRAGEQVFADRFRRQVRFAKAPGREGARLP